MREGKGEVRRAFFPWEVLFPKVGVVLFGHVGVVTVAIIIIFWGRLPLLIVLCVGPFPVFSGTCAHILIILFCY